ALRKQLDESGDKSRVQIANQKYAVMHSTRYSPGPSGWAGADSNNISLASFQRNLSRAAEVTRTTEGGFNRIAFAPVQSPAVTSPSVHPRIAELMRWHYGHDGAASELQCVAGADVNCRCLSN